MLEDAIDGLAGKTNDQHVAALVAVRDSAGLFGIGRAAPPELVDEMLDAISDFCLFYRNNKEADHATH